MKKNLLIAAAICAAFSASAQIEVGFLDAEQLGLADKPVLPAGTVLAETANIKLTLANEQECSKQNPDFNGMKQFIVNGQTIDLVAGIGGNSNPAGVNVTANPSQGGCQYRLDVNADGWVVIPSKFSSNKNFYAYEGDFAGEMNIMAYTLGMEFGGGSKPEEVAAWEAAGKPAYGVYTLPATEFGYFDKAAPTADKYLLGGTAIAWPIRICTQDPAAGSVGNGTGAMMFPVFKDAAIYYFFATGSKMNTPGFIFVPGQAMPNVTVYGPERINEETSEVTPAKSFAISGELQVPGEAGIEDIIANEVENADAPMFNVLGQRVNESYKGLVIKNGKKFINK